MGDIWIGIQQIGIGKIAIALFILFVFIISILNNTRRGVGGPMNQNGQQGYGQQPNMGGFGQHPQQNMGEKKLGLFNRQGKANRQMPGQPTVGQRPPMSGQPMMGQRPPMPGQPMMGQRPPMPGQPMMGQNPNTQQVGFQNPQNPNMMR